MRTFSRLSTPGVIALVVLLLAGCGGETKVAPVAVGEMQEYRDPMYGFHFHHPKGWVGGGETGRARIYNTLEAGQRFLDPLGAYPDGVVIAVDVTRTPDPAGQKEKMLAEMKSSGRTVSAETPVTVNGKQGTLVTYGAVFSSKVKETGQHVYVSLDTLLYDIEFAGFGGLYEAHKAVFDHVLTSFEFPKPVEKGRDQTLPSATLSDYATPFFSFQYPDNYNFETIPKGNNELALSLRGANRSSSIQFTVFGAKGLTLEKVFDQNKGKFSGAAAGKATVGGEPSMTLTYSASKDVERRFYFVVKNDKVIRVTLDWLKPQRTDYLAAYDQVIASIKFK
jgi:hypothetical protein